MPTFYGVAEPGTGFLVNHVSGQLVWDLFARMASAGDTALIAPGVPTMIFSEAVRVHLSEDLAEDAVALGSAADTRQRLSQYDYAGADMRDLSPRLARRIHNDFGAHAPEVIARLGAVELIGAVDVERVLAGIVLWAAGDLRRLEEAASLSAIDWRDALVLAGLEHSDWPSRLDHELGN